jgi:lactoylglutathione lyase
MPGWDQRKPSIVFECDGVHATMAAMKSRGVLISQEATTMTWGRFAAFRDNGGFEHGLREA